MKDGGEVLLSFWMWTINNRHGCMCNIITQNNTSTVLVYLKKQK